MGKPAAGFEQTGGTGWASNPPIYRQLTCLAMEVASRVHRWSLLSFRCGW